MRDRTFARVSVPRGDDGRRHAAAEIVCGVCSAREVVINGTRGQHMPPEVVAQKFQRQGWKVAQAPSGDRCPACSAKRRPALKIVGGTTGQHQEEPMANAKPAEPIEAHRPGPAVTITVDQKRRINAKLHEVWDGGATGYSRGWSDHAVAEALGVPRAAVAQIRSEFFGEARDNPEVRDFLERADILFDAAAQIEAKVAALLGEAKTLAAGIEVMRRDVSAIRKVVGAA